MLGSISPGALFQSTITLRALPRILLILYSWVDTAFTQYFSTLVVSKWDNERKEVESVDNILQLWAAPVNCAFGLLTNIWFWYGHIPLATRFVVEPVWIKYWSYSSWGNRNGSKTGKRIIWFHFSELNRIKDLSAAFSKWKHWSPAMILFRWYWHCIHCCHIQSTHHLFTLEK